MHGEHFIADEAMQCRRDRLRREALEQFDGGEAHDAWKVRTLLERRGRTWIEQTMSDWERLESVKGSDH